MDTWNRLTAVRGKGAWGDWLKEGEGISQKNMCMTHGHGQWCGDCLREYGGAGWTGAKGENWDNCNSIIYKI